MATFLAANPQARLVPERACGKTRYVNSSTAQAALVVIARYGDRDPDGRIPVRAYPCPECEGWHLTSWPTPDAPPLCPDPRQNPT